MESTTMCACGCGRTATGNVRGWEGVGIPDGTPYSMACMGGSSGVDAFAMRLKRVADVPRIHAELVALRDGTGVRDTPAPQADSGFKVGDRVRINKRTADGCGGVYKRPGNNGTVTAVAATTTVLFDCGISSTYDRDDRKLEPLPPSEDPKRQPEANPLRHLAEAFRGLDKVACANCRVPCSHALVMRGAGPGWCKYCDNRVRVEPGRVFASATPKEDERREVWDWPVDSDAPDGCA